MNPLLILAYYNAIYLVDIIYVYIYNSWWLMYFQGKLHFSSPARELKQWSPGAWRPKFLLKSAYGQNACRCVWKWQGSRLFSAENFPRYFNGDIKKLDYI